MAARAPVELRYVVSTRADWTISEETVPESHAHDLTIDLLKAVLLALCARRGLEAVVARNLAVRFTQQSPRIGVDPDVCVLAPPPPVPRDELDSLRLWLPGHAPPLVAIEVVSANHPTKDYESAPERYAVSGAQELWVFDPKLVGPKRLGPSRIQLWRRDASGAFERVYAGEGPVWSNALGVALVTIEEGQRLRLATDALGTDLVPTAEEAERAAKDTERAAKDTERAAKDTERAAKEAALARVAELEARLAKLDR